MSDLRIGELATRIGVPTETIRYYEREGLLPQPRRTDGNYRVYDASLVERLAFVRNCRALDITLDEIRSLLALRDQPERGCDSVNQLVEKHIATVSERITSLQRLEEQLRGLRSRCSRSETVGNCAILSGLSSGEGSARVLPA